MWWLILKDAVKGAVLGALFQLVLGLIFSTQPWWNTRIVVICAAVLVVGGILDRRRASRQVGQAGTSA